MLETGGGVLVDVEAFVAAQYGYDVRTELVCENGMVMLAPNPPMAVRLDGRDGFKRLSDWRGRFAGAYRNQLRAWIESMATGRPVGSSAWDGCAASETVAACFDAYRTHAKAPVRLDAKPGFYEDA